MCTVTLKTRQHYLTRLVLTHALQICVLLWQSPRHVCLADHLLSFHIPLRVGWRDSWDRVHPLRARCI